LDVLLKQLAVPDCRTRFGPRQLQCTTVLPV
jgi:hypothetical protein